MKLKEVIEWVQANYDYMVENDWDEENREGQRLALVYLRNLDRTHRETTGRPYPPLEGPAEPEAKVATCTSRLVVGPTDICCELDANDDHTVHRRDVGAVVITWE